MASDADVGPQFEEEFRGSGALFRKGVTIQLPSFTVKREKYDPTAEWEFNAAIVNPDQQAWKTLLTPGPGALEFRGKLEWGPDVVIPHLHSAYPVSHGFRGRAQEVIVGPATLGRAPSRQSIYVQLWPTPLASAEVDNLISWWTGEIKQRRRKGTKTQKPVMPTIDFGIGRMRFARHYQFDTLRVAGVESKVVIPHPALSGTVNGKSKSRDLQSVYSQFDEDLDDFVRLLTFLSRRHVRWSRIHIRNEWMEGGKRQFDEQKRIRATTSTKGERHRDALVNAHRLAPGDLNTLYQSYKASPMKQSIASAIIYIVAGHDAPFVDARIANAYTAFEAIVSAVSEHEGAAFTMTSAEFKKLARRVRAAVTEFAVDSKIDDVTKDAVIAKVPELRRRGIVDQAVRCIENNHIHWQDAWPSGASLGEVLSKLYARRNLFIHAGQLGNIGQASVDAERILLLAERLIFSLLNGDPKWHDPSSFRIAHILRREPEPVVD